MAEGAPPTAAAVANDSFPVFAHLPVELMVRIVEYLSPRDIARLHCVARALRDSLLADTSINAAMAAYRQLHHSQGARTRALLRNLVTRPWNTPILDLTGNRIGDRGLSAFAGAVTSGALPQLTELRLDWNRIGDAGVEALAKACASGSLPPLGGLFLNTNQIGDAGATALAGVCASGALPQLTLIDLAFNRIGDDGLNAFALAVASGALPHLTTLALSSNSIGDRGMQSLADACARGAMPQLTKLYLAGNQIGDAGITALAAACGRGGLPQLTTLYLFSNKIGDAGVTALAGACASGSLPQLTLLSLGSNRIGDDGLSALAGAVASGAALASLRTLWLHENKIGDEALIAFSEALGKGALPKCIDIYLLRNPASREAQQAVKDAIKNRSTWSWRAAPSVGPSSSSPLAQEVIEHMAEGAPPTAAVAKDAKSPRVDDSFPDVFARLPDDLMARILREARAIEVAVARTHPDPGPYWAGPCSQLFARVRQLHISRESAWLHWRTMPISSLDTGPLAASPTEAAERGVAELYNGSRTAHYCGITTVARNPFIRDLRTFIPDEVRILARDLVCRPLAYSAEGWASLRASGPPAPDRVFAARGEANAQNVMQAVNKGCRDRVARIRVAAAATAAPSVGPSSSSPLAQEVIEHMAEGAPPTAAAVANDSFPVFAHLPVELMVRIVEYLSPRDIARLHCVARALQSSLLDERSINDAMTAYRQLHDSQDSQGARTRASLRILVTRPWNTPTLYLTGNGIRGIGDRGLSAFAGAVASGALPQLTTLCLVSNKFGDKGMIAFSEALGKGALPQLTRLDLEHNGIGDAGIMALVAACGRGALASLQVLGLGVNQIGDAGATACGNGSLPQLKELNLWNNKIGDAGVTALASACASGSLTKLEKLYLHRNQIGDAGVTALADVCASGSLPQLTELLLGENEIGDAGISALATACASGALPKCTCIVLGDNPASEDAGHAVQDALKRRWLNGEFLATHLNEITELDMSYMEWGDAEMIKLAAALEYCHGKGALPQLKELYPQSNQIGDAGVSALASACASGALPQLKELHLGANKIGDAGVSALAGACASGALPQLTHLNLSANSIGDPGMQSLADACGALPQLEELWLSNNKIGDPGLASLTDACARGALPKLETLVVDDGPLGTEHPALKAACQDRGIRLR